MRLTCHQPHRKPWRAPLQGHPHYFSLASTIYRIFFPSMQTETSSYYKHCYFKPHYYCRKKIRDFFMWVVPILTILTYICVFVCANKMFTNMSILFIILAESQYYFLILGTSLQYHAICSLITTCFWWTALAYKHTSTQLQWNRIYLSTLCFNGAKIYTHWTTGIWCVILDPAHSFTGCQWVRAWVGFA